MTHAQLRALCAAILRAELEPDGINVTAYEKTAYAVEQADRLLAALGIAQEEPVSNADELVAIRARVAELERQYAEAEVQWHDEWFRGSDYHLIEAYLNGEPVTTEFGAPLCKRVIEREDALRAENARMREALERLLKACPQALSCDDFAHTRNTFHNYDEPCEPQIEYLAAQDYARAALEVKP